MKEPGRRRGMFSSKLCCCLILITVLALGAGMAWADDDDDRNVGTKALHKDHVVTTGGDAPPANDTCAGAINIPAGPFPILSGLTTGQLEATSAGDPAALCAPGEQGVWYTFTPTVSQTYRIRTCNPPTATNTGADTIIQLFTSDAGCGGTFTGLADGCNDDSCALFSTVFPALTAGTTYYILVYHFVE